MSGVTGQPGAPVAVQLLTVRLRAVTGPGSATYRTVERTARERTFKLRYVGPWSSKSKLAGVLR